MPKPQPKPTPAEEPEVVRRARELIATCEAELGVESEPARLARLHYEIGRAYEEPIGEDRNAMKHYRAALEQSDEHLVSIRSLRRLLLRRKPYDEAVPLFDAEIRVTADPHRKAALYVERGRVLEDLLRNPDGARKSYAQAAELDPSSAAAIKAREQAERDASSWPNVDQTYALAANAAGNDRRHRAALLVARAGVLELRANDASTAAELYQQALEMDPAATGAVEALKRLLHAQARWGDLITVLGHEAEQATDVGTKASALFQVGRIFSERLGDRAQAIASLEQAAQLAPSDDLVLEELAKHHEAAENHQDVARVLGRLVEIVDDESRLFSLMHRLGEVCERHIDRIDAAIRCYESVLAQDPTYVPVLRALGRIYNQRQAWEPLIQMHLAEAGASHDSLRKADAHAHVAKIYESHLGDLDKALEHHAQAIALAPKHVSSFKALSRLLTQAGRHRELVELYQRAIDSASDNEVAIAHLFKIGSLYEGAIGDPGEAVHAYKQILSRVPNHLGAVQALQRAAETAGKNDELVAALEQEAKLTSDEAKVVSLIHRAGEVFDEKLDDQQQALARYRRALEIDPAHAPALASLGRLYHRSGRWDDLLSVYKDELELTNGAAARAALLHRMGELCEERIGDQDQALAHYRAALQAHPSYLPAIRALSAGLRARKDWDGVVELLEAELSRLHGNEDRARTAYRIGDVHEMHRQDLQAAAASYRRAVEAVRGYGPAQDGIARVESKLANWTDLATELEAEASRVEDARLASESLFRAARIWHVCAGQPKRAIDCLQTILRGTPGQIAALLALEPLYREVEDWNELATVYSQQAQALIEPGPKIAAMHELARTVTRHRLGDDAAVRDIHLAILEIDPTDSGALAELERIANAAGDGDLRILVQGRAAQAEHDPTLRSAQRTRLAQALEQRDEQQAFAAFHLAMQEDPDNLAAIRGLRRMGAALRDPKAYADASRREAELLRDPQSAAELLIDSAEAKNGGLGDTAGAVKDLEQALERQPNHERAAKLLAKWLLQTGSVDHLLEVLARAAEAATLIDRKGDLWQQVALLHVEHKHNLGAGVAALRRTLKEDPDHVPTLMLLADLYERGQQWHEAVEILVHLTQAAPKQASEGGVWLRLGRIYVRHLEDAKASLDPLKTALRLDPHNRDAMQLMAEASAREGDVKGALATMKRLVREAETAAQRADVLTQLARIQRHAGDTDAALQALHEAVTLAGEVGEAAQQYQSALHDPSHWARYADAIRQHLLYLENGEIERADPGSAFIELARVQSEHLGQDELSLQTLREGVQRHASDLRLVTHYAERLQSGGRPDQAITALQDLLAQDPTGAGVWRGLAGAYEALGRSAQAAVALAPLVVLGAAEDSDATKIERARKRPGVATSGTLGVAALPQLTGSPRGEKRVIQLLVYLAEPISKLYAPDLRQYGLSSRDKISDPTGHPLRGVSERVAAAMGIAEHDLYVVDAGLPDATLELTHPPALVVPAQIGRLSEGTQVFALARALAPVGWGAHAATKLGAREAASVLAAAGRSVVPGFGAALDDGMLDDLSKRVIKATSRRNRKALQEAAQAYANVQQFDVKAWVEALALASLRVAALLAGDLTQCVTYLRMRDASLANHQGAALVQSSPLIHDLMRYWASAAAFELRGRAGLL